MSDPYANFNFRVSWDGDAVAADDGTIYYFDGVNLTDQTHAIHADDPIDLVWDFTDSDVRNAPDTTGDDIA